MPRTTHTPTTTQTDPNGHRRLCDRATQVTTTPTEDDTWDPDPAAEDSGTQTSARPRRPKPRARLTSNTRLRACREIVTGRD